MLFTEGICHVAQETRTVNGHYFNGSNIGCIVHASRPLNIDHSANVLACRRNGIRTVSTMHVDHKIGGEEANNFITWHWRAAL